MQHQVLPCASRNAHVPKKFEFGQLLPFIGPIALFVFWYVAVSAGWVNKVLMPSPVDTINHLFDALANGNMMGDIDTTFMRVPLGIALGSSEPAYRSVEFLIDFFRSTPSSALIPLFLLIFGITDANKIAIASFAAVLVILFNSAYGVMHARKTRILAARVMGANSWQIFRDAARKPVANLRRSAQWHQHHAGDRDRGRNVYRFRKRPGPSHHRCATDSQRQRYVRIDPRNRCAWLRA
jgi:hypothetical protein